MSCRQSDGTVKEIITQSSLRGLGIEQLGEDLEQFASMGTPRAVEKPEDRQGIARVFLILKVLRTQSLISFWTLKAAGTSWIVDPHHDAVVGRRSTIACSPTRRLILFAKMLIDGGFL